MKTGLSLTDLAKEVDRRESAKRDFVLATSSITMQTMFEEERGKPVNQKARFVFTVGGDTLTPHVSSLAHDQLGTFLDIPSKYYDRLMRTHPALLDVNVNTLMRSSNAKRMVRTLDGNARAFLSDRYRRMDHFQLLAAILPTFQARNDLQYASMDVTENKMYLKVVTDELTAEVKKGDAVRMGLCVRNSEVGLGRLAVDPFIERLVCTNGMTVTEYGMSRNHAGRRVGVDGEDASEMFTDETQKADDHAFFLKVRDLVQNTLSTDVFQRVIGDMRRAAGEKIEGDVSQAVTELGKAYTLRDEERASVLRNLIDGGDTSRWGVLNAVTRTAGDARDYDRASELEVIGGRILTMTPAEWRPIATAA